ncbi:MAG: flavodoxin family protein [Oscillospiraceae bacterium]|nr:flavodoxin family protein [Oscillospiraceae bacterium]
MKVLLINGSPRPNGNTTLALQEMERVFAAEGIEAETLRIGSEAIRGCIACYSCSKTGKCVFDDAVNVAAEKFRDADGLVVASPVYYASPNGTVEAFMDRLFCSTPFDKTMKVGAAVAVARRAGTTATMDALNKYFSISGMPIASSQYWNDVFGRGPGEAAQDAEGLQTVRVLARNMAFLMKSIALGKERFGLPEKEPRAYTHYIR